MHTLRLLERLLAVDYSALSLLRELDLWGVTYSAAFFGFAESQARHSSCKSLKWPLSMEHGAALTGMHALDIRKHYIPWHDMLL